jgi:hypothetical protein
MSISDGAKSADDPVLSGALSEMISEGAIDTGATLSDLGADDASQASGDVSAAPAAAQPSTGDDGSSPAGVAPATASPTTPDLGAAPAAADPLAGTEPFTYSVNGETRTLDGVRRVPGEGFFAPEEHVASLQQLAERAEILDRVSRDVTAQNANYERLSTWTVTDGEGREQTLTGPQGLEALRVDYARMQSAVAVIDGILEDPAKLLGLLAQDAQGRIVADPSAIETLSMRIQLAANAAADKTRSSFTARPAPSASSAPSAAPDYAASAPRLIEQSSPNHAALTPADRTLLSEQIARYVRPVTEDDRRWNPALKVGGQIVDAAFSKLVQHMVTQRTAEKQQLQATERAGKVNAGMDRGRFTNAERRQAGTFQWLSQAIASPRTPFPRCRSCSERRRPVC